MYKKYIWYREMPFCEVEFYFSNKTRIFLKCNLCKISFHFI